MTSSKASHSGPRNIHEKMHVISCVFDHAYLIIILRSYCVESITLYKMVWLFPVFALALSGCGKTKVSPKTPKANPFIGEFKIVVTKFYESNGWGSSGPDWSNFDTAAKLAQSSAGATTILDKNGVSLASLFESAVKHVQSVIEEWLKQQAEGRPIPPFSQGLSRIMAASRLVRFGSDKGRLSGLPQHDKDRLMRDGLRALASVQAVEDPMTIMAFTEQVGTCRQRFEISSEEGKESFVNDPKVCFQKALDSMEAIAVLEAGGHRINGEIRESVKRVFTDITRSMGKATALGRVEGEEYPRPVTSVYEDLAKAYDLGIKLHQLFLVPPAISVRERNERASDKIKEIEGMLAKIDGAVDKQRRKDYEEREARETQISVDE